MDGKPILIPVKMKKLMEKDKLKALKRQLLQRELARGLNALDNGEYAGRSIQEIRKSVRDKQDEK